MILLIRGVANERKNLLLVPSYNFRFQSRMEKGQLGYLDLYHQNNNCGTFARHALIYQILVVMGGYGSDIIDSRYC